MRRLSVLAVSAAVHAGALAWVLAADEPARRRSPPVAPAPTVEIAPTEVVLLDDVPDDVAALSPDRGGASEVAAVAPRPSAGRGRGGDSEHPAGDGPAGDATPAGPPARNPWMDMRKGRPVRLTVGVPTGRWDGRARAPEIYGPDIDTGRLHPSGGGTHRSDEGVFTAKVDRDGSVTLKDKRNLRVRFAVPGPKSIGRAIARWYQDDNKPVGLIGPPDIERYERERLGDRGKPGDPMPEPLDDDADDKPDNGGTVALLGGSFDVTDALMRRKGMDPYASRKLAYLDATRDQRVQIGLRHRQQQLARATEFVQGNLDRAWATTADPAARREALFELWDDCAETGPEVVVEAGAAARALVVGFIRARLPAGSPDAYSSEDLARLNRRRSSRAVFAPYE